MLPHHSPYDTYWPPDEPTTEFLEDAVCLEQFPVHPQTCEDWGFNRATSSGEKLNLLNLYRDLLLYFDIPLRTVNDWRVHGVLVDKIKETFHKTPKDGWPERASTYFPWFLRHQDIIALASQPLPIKELREHSDDILSHSWIFVGGSRWDSPEKIRTIIALEPAEVRRCHSMYTLLLSGSSPSAGSDLWIDFGFAACTSKRREGVLGDQYRQLINNCTFTEFCNAYRNRHLLELFHSKGLEIYENIYLRDLLSDNVPFGCWKSVWDLKEFVLRKESPREDHDIPFSVKVDYGFVNCRDDFELRQLKKVYRDFFVSHHEDPLMLHEAAMKGILYGLLSSIVRSAQNPTFRRLLKNPYPHSDQDTSPSDRLFQELQASLSVFNTGTLVWSAGIGGLFLGMYLTRLLSRR